MFARGGNISCLVRASSTPVMPEMPVELELIKGEVSGSSAPGAPLFFSRLPGLSQNRNPTHTYLTSLHQRRSDSTTPLLRNPTDVRHCSQHAGANVDFGDESAVDWAFLGNLKQLRALLWVSRPANWRSLSMWSSIPSFVSQSAQSAA